MTEEESKSDFYSAFRNALVSEVAANELRARRSLRVLQHQEERLSVLENELSGKSNLLRDMQESHTDLLEAYHYQTEVQDLQKQLIKMQEIQYLNEFIQANSSGGGKSSSTTDANRNEFTKLGSSLKPSTSSDLDGERKFGLENNSRTALFKTFPAEGSRDSDDDISKMKTATDKAAAALPAVDENRMFGLLRSSLGSGEGSLPQKSSSKDSKYSNESPSSSEGSDSKTNYFTGLKSKKENRSTEDNENVEQQLRNDSQQLSTSFYDDGDEKISILKETLSSHRQSIEDLSTEVVQLRKERVELLTYVQNLLQLKNKTEDMLNKLPESKDSVAEMLSRKELSYIMPVSKNDCKMINSDYDNQNQIPQPLVNKHRSKSRHVTINVVRCNSGSTGDGDATNYNHNGASRLEDRARRMWETACRFFTPQQAHFILTAPVPSDNEEEEGESAVEDELPYY